MANILIVDDDPTIRTMFGRALQSLGEVEQAGSGADALRMLGARKFSVLLLDLHMPVIDGFAILHALATKPGPNRDTPVFVVTADISDQARIRALRRHAVFFLTKPVPIGTLIALVDSTLKKSAARAAMPAKPAATGAMGLGAGLGKTSAASSQEADGRVSSLPLPPVSASEGGGRVSSLPERTSSVPSSGPKKAGS